MQPEQVVLVNPPGPPRQTTNRDGAGGLGATSLQPGGFRYPPLTLAGAAAVLRQARQSPLVIEAVGEGLDTGETIARVPQDTRVAVVLASWTTAASDREFLLALRAARPHAQILLLAAALEDWDSGSLTDLADAWTLGDPGAYIDTAIEAQLDGQRGALGRSL